MGGVDWNAIIVWIGYAPSIYAYMISATSVYAQYCSQECCRLDAVSFPSYCDPTPLTPTLDVDHKQDQNEEESIYRGLSRSVDIYDGI